MSELIRVGVRDLRRQLRHVDECCMVSAAASYRGSAKDRRKATRASDHMDGLGNLLSVILDEFKKRKTVTLLRCK